MGFGATNLHFKAVSFFLLTLYSKTLKHQVIEMFFTHLQITENLASNKHENNRLGIMLQIDN